MYVILVNNDNTLTASVKQRIMQRSNVVDTLYFLVPPTYNGIDMSSATVVMKYKLPVSNEFKTKILKKSEQGHEEFLKYVLPKDNIGVELTAQPGKIELFLTFIYVDMDEQGNIWQRVRQTSPATIDVIPIPNWSDVIPDAALDVIDQRLIKVDAQIRALDDLGNTLGNGMVNNLAYNDEDETLYLMSNDMIIGDKVSVRDMIDDGIPIVDLNSTSSNKPGSSDGCGCNCDCWDNVVEFGDEQKQTGCNCGCEDNVVEFDGDANVVNF